MKRSQVLLWGGALLAAALVYAPTLDGDFLLDDYGLGLLTDREGAVSWPAVWSYFFPSHLTRDQFLRPLPVLSGALDLAVWGANPFGFHLTNLLVHLLGALLVGMVASRLSPRSGVGPLATLVYGLYPGNAEAVAWVIHRMVGLTVVFYLLALLLHTSPRLRPVAWLSALAALLCKEPAANLPAAVFLLHFYLYRHADRRARVLAAARHAVPYLVAVVIFVVWKRLAFGGVVTGYGKYDSYFAYFLGEKIYLDLPMSLLRFLSPVNGTVVPGLVVWLHGMVTCVGIGLLMVHAYWRTRTRYAFLFGLALALLSLILVFPFLSVPAGLTNSRHFSVPAMGLAMALGALAAAVPRTGRVMAGLWIVLYCAPLVPNLMPYRTAGNLARTIRTEVERITAAYPEDVTVVVARVPSAVHGAPVFGDGSALRGALAPPFAARAHRVIATLDDPPGDPDAVLLTLTGPVAALEIEPGGTEVREVSPPVAAWRYDAPHTVERLRPAEDARVVLAEDPPFVFRSERPLPFYRLVFRAGAVVLPVTVARDRQLEVGPEGRLTYRLSRGDVHGRTFLDRADLRALRGPVAWWVEGVRDFTRPRSAVARSTVGLFLVEGP
jgi:hypothetical protein